MNFDEELLVYHDRTVIRSMVSTLEMLHHDLIVHLELQEALEEQAEIDKRKS